MFPVMAHKLVTQQVQNVVGASELLGTALTALLDFSQVEGNVVRIPWNTDWTLIVWDFTVPSTYYTYVTTGASYPNAMPCNPVQIDTMVPWFEGRTLFDNAYAYFSEPQLYINP
jgi:hypothetical protein